MKIRWLTLLSLAVCALFFAGCSSMPKLTGITIRLDGLKLNAPPSGEAHAVLTLRFVNENIVPIAIRNAVYKLYLNGAYIGEAQARRPAGVPPMSASETQTLTLPLTDAALIGRLRTLLAADAVSYRLEGQIFASTYGEANKVSIRSAGTLDLRRAESAP